MQPNKKNKKIIISSPEQISWKGSFIFEVLILFLFTFVGVVIPFTFFEKSIFTEDLTLSVLYFVLVLIPFVTISTDLAATFAIPHLISLSKKEEPNISTRLFHRINPQNRKQLFFKYLCRFFLVLSILSFTISQIVLYFFIIL